MTDRRLISLGKATVASLGMAVGVTALVSPQATLGVAVGGAWNLTSLWCLTRLLASWLGPQRSTRQVVGWSPHLPPQPTADLTHDAGIETVRSVSGPPTAGRWQVGGWLLVKFPLLYLLAFWLMCRPAVSFLGFGVGFSVVLVTAVAGLAIHARRMIPPPATPRQPAGFTTKKTDLEAANVVNAPHPARLGVGRQQVGG